MPLLWVSEGLIGYMKQLLTLLVTLTLTTICGAKSDIGSYDYNIVGVAVAKEGYYLVEVSAMVDKKKDATLDIAKKCAIHGCLFKGFAIERMSQKPLLSSPTVVDEHHDFFEKLLNEKYEEYTNCTHPIQIIKVQKRYKVKAIVVIAKDALRKCLEEAGIVNKLGL